MPLGKLQTRCRVPFASAAVLEMGLSLQPASSRKSPGDSNFSHSWMMAAIVLTDVFKATKPFLYNPVLEVSRQFLLLPSCLACVLRCIVCLPKPCPMNSVYLRSPAGCCRNISWMISGSTFMLHAKGCENFRTSDFLVFYYCLVEFAKISKIVFSSCHDVALFVGKRELNPFLNIMWNGMQ